ncbi:hypothetical protein HCJ92_19805 [Streptomyces sp. ventii]|uniref:DoxX family membrane protein n=1 Tax=Streptomyces spiramenti TaxID=2720606 RepID=A0ABX1AUJ7_9ACTN|nr:hypothetical protein [Streptomyces spiramenti]
MTDTPVPPHPWRGTAAALAVTRLMTAAIFLWAFADKAFGLGYATPGERSWVNGGSPTGGYLSSVDVGPMAGVFNSWAGSTAVDVLFMGGLLAVGVALLAGVALWPAALGGGLMMLMMWVAAWPPARELADGTPSMSTNPLVDHHLLYVAVLVVLAATAAGHHAGLGRRWEEAPLARRFPWLR